MPLLTDIGLLATCADGGGQGEVHLLSDAALAWEGATLLWVGPEEELPDKFSGFEVHSARGRLVVPGLIDCHTHLAFGGWRADELEERLLGTSYLEIARRGGGIGRTVAQTRSASEETLGAHGAAVLRAMARLGVTTVECKSGYGLNVEEELKLLRVYARLQRTQPLRLVPTFLGAHVVPSELSGDRQRYLDLVVGEMLPAAAELASFCDVFVEEGAFSAPEARRILQAARQRGLGLKLHVDQLQDGGGGCLAAELGATSADHLEYLSEAGITAMAESGVVAVSLPIASFFLRQPPMPARRLVEAGVPVAIATDFNPGTAPSFHLPWALLLACVGQGLTAREALKGATLNAAKALALEHEIGSLEPGKAADFVIVDAPDVEHWLYHFTPNAAVETVVAGVFLGR